MRNSSKTKRDHAALSDTRQRLRQKYDQLWSQAIGPIAAGKVSLDPVLQAPSPDIRRGLTVIGRPSLAVRSRVRSFLTELRNIEPGQYFYSPSECHLTILSLFTATADWRPQVAKRHAYLSAVTSALKTARPLTIEFRGVTASPETVMIQGFFEDDRLNELRDRLRHELRTRSLGTGLDDRYRLESAHVTVVRFRTPLCRSKEFAELLSKSRERFFGTTVFKTLSLVENDWYMSGAATKLLRRFNLAA